MERRRWISGLLLVLCSSASFAQNQTPLPKEEPLSRQPLYFDIQDKEFQIIGPKVIYDLKSSRGERLEFGQGLVFSQDSFVPEFVEESLRFTWNTKLIQTGEISMFTEQGKEIWKQSATTAGSHSYKLNEGAATNPLWREGESFRFCIRSDQGRGYTGICSPFYGIERKGKLEMKLVRGDANPRVILKNEESPLRGEVEVAIGAPVQFLATLKSNATYEFLSEPTAVVVRDLALDAEKLYLTGEMPAPLQLESQKIPGTQWGSFTRKIGFESTMANEADLWQASILKKGTLLFPGKAGGVFSYSYSVNQPPQAHQRQYYVSSTAKQTYSDTDRLELQSENGEVQVWEFAVPNKFEVNRVYIDIPALPGAAESEGHRAYLDVYRGGAGEASLRLTGAASVEGSYVLLAEAHVSWWFNELFGWQNATFSRQRWGVSAKYFSSMMDFKAETGDGEGESSSISAMDVDLRYRLTPGLWERDETVGLILGYESLSFASLSVPKVGVGVFWARSMPRVFDEWLSELPYMNYPKWVDMEFITYIASPDSTIALQGDYAINFHGKILWTPRFFGEAGFGLKHYSFTQDSAGLGAKLATFYGTLGIGINF